MAQVVINMTDDKICSIGSYWLSGHVYKETDDINTKNWDVLLRFPQKSSQWCAQNKGPRDLIMFEFNLPCLLHDLISIIQRGGRVTVETYEE